MKQDEKNWWKDPFIVFTRVSAWIAVPVIIALFVGQYLDTKWGTEPWAFIGVTGFAFLFSCYGIVREVKRYSKNIESKNGNRTDDNSNN